MLTEEKLSSLGDVVCPKCQSTEVMVVGKIYQCGSCGLKEDISPRPCKMCRNPVLNKQEWDLFGHMHSKCENEYVDVLMGSHDL